MDYRRDLRRASNLTIYLMEIRAGQLKRINLIFFFFCSPPVQKFKQSSFFLHPNPKEIPCKNVPAPLCALSGGRDHSEPGWPSWMLAAKHKKIHFRNHFFPQRMAKKDKRTFSVERNAENFNSWPPQSLQTRKWRLCTIVNMNLAPRILQKIQPNTFLSRDGNTT